MKSIETPSKVGGNPVCCGGMIGVIGLGYVGLPLSLPFAGSGAAVLGFDIDPEKIRRIEAGENYIKHIDSARSVVAAYEQEMREKSLRRTHAAPTRTTDTGTELRPKENRFGSPEMEITGVVLRPGPTLSPGGTLGIENRASRGTIPSDFRLHGVGQPAQRHRLPRHEHAVRTRRRGTSQRERHHPAGH